MDNANKSKYESILKILNQQFSLGYTKGPKSITKLNSVLNNHEFDRVYIKSKINQRNQVSKEKEVANEKEKPLLSTFAQIEGRFYWCGKYGHKSTQCRLKDTKPKHEWYLNTIPLTETKKERSKLSDKYNAKYIRVKFRFNNYLKIIFEKNMVAKAALNRSSCRRNKDNALKDLVLLDSDSTNTIFCNKDYVENIRKAKTTLEIQTNGGTLTVMQPYEIPFLGTHGSMKEP